MGFSVSHPLMASESLRRDLKLLEDLSSSAVFAKVLWFGCSDARVTPTDITDADTGELFIVRNVANIVPPEGAGEGSVAAAIDYAIGHLGVQHIVVCGHTDCKGIQALGTGLDAAASPHLARWIEHARPAHRLVTVAPVTEESRFLETIKANVLLQEDHVRSYVRVKQAKAAGQISLHAWFYDLGASALYAYDRDTGEWAVIADIED